MKSSFMVLCAAGLLSFIPASPDTAVEPDRAAVPGGRNLKAVPKEQN